MRSFSTAASFWSTACSVSAMGLTSSAMAICRFSRSPFTCWLVLSSEARASAVSDWLLACRASDAIDRKASRSVCSALDRIVWR